VAPASFLINDRLSVMLSLQVFELWTRQAVQESCSRANAAGYSGTKIWDFHLKK